MMSSFFASPGRLLVIHHLQSAVVVGAACLLLFQGVLTALWDGREATGCLWTLGLYSVFELTRLPSFLVIECGTLKIRDDVVLGSFTLPAAREAAQLWASLSCRVVMFSILMACYDLCAVLWRYEREPCREKFGWSDEDAARCEVFELVCTGCMLFNSVLAYVSVLSLEANYQFREEFESRRDTLSLALLEQMPSFHLAYGRDAETPGTCAVCLENMVSGDKLRRLFCGHCFHAGCVDPWLARSASCPLRCHVDLLETARQWARRSSQQLCLEGETTAGGC
mmetsp:Transcript_11193/g.30971  ORF Transcript_11193/g.30971 Transcript_11193/m.30971 type:complete len:281 (-) Transcript_11193:439-1281(-)